MTRATQITAFRIDARDNVATAMSSLQAGQTVSVLGAVPTELAVSESIESGHKVAVTAIPAGGAVVKYGITIGTATRAIAPGQWVHLHNCRSNYDERSAGLDLRSGAPTDTRYA